MSFQWIIDNAETLSINRKKMVASTVSRNGVTRATNRGILPKRIEVKLPDGIPWSDNLTNIQSAESLDRYTTSTIEIKYSLFPWYYNYTMPSSNETYTVLCTQFPEWTIFARNQVSWSGTFVFIEQLS